MSELLWTLIERNELDELQAAESAEKYSDDVYQRLRGAIHSEAVVERVTDSQMANVLVVCSSTFLVLPKKTFGRETLVPGYLFDLFYLCVCGLAAVLVSFAFMLAGHAACIGWNDALTKLSILSLPIWVGISIWLAYAVYHAIMPSYRKIMNENTNIGAAGATIGFWFMTAAFFSHDGGRATFAEAIESVRTSIAAATAGQQSVLLLAAAAGTIIGTNAAKLAMHIKPLRLLGCDKQFRYLDHGYNLIDIIGECSKLDDKDVRHHFLVAAFRCGVRVPDRSAHAEEMAYARAEAEKMKEDTKTVVAVGPLKLPQSMNVASTSMKQAENALKEHLKTKASELTQLCMTADDYVNFVKNNPEKFCRNTSSMKRVDDPVTKFAEACKEVNMEATKHASSEHVKAALEQAIDLSMASVLSKAGVASYKVPAYVETLQAMGYDGLSIQVMTSTELDQMIIDANMPNGDAVKLRVYQAGRSPSSFGDSLATAVRKCCQCTSVGVHHGGVAGSKLVTSAVSVFATGLGRGLAGTRR